MAPIKPASEVLRPTAPTGLTVRNATPAEVEEANRRDGKGWRPAATPPSAEFTELFNPEKLSPTLAGSAQEAMLWVLKATETSKLDAFLINAGKAVHPFEQKTYLALAGMTAVLPVTAPLLITSALVEGGQVTGEEAGSIAQAFKKLSGLERAIVGEAVVLYNVEKRATDEARALLRDVFKETQARPMDERVLLRDFVTQLFSLTRGGIEDADQVPLEQIKAKTRELVSQFHEAMSKGQDPHSSVWQR
jgi:hypothetical protein